MVTQPGLVAFTDFTRDIETESGAAASGGEERLENLVNHLRGYTRAIIQNIELRCTGGGIADCLQPDVNRGVRLAMVYGVLAQVPDHLVQLARIHVGLQVGGFDRDADLLRGTQAAG